MEFEHLSEAERSGGFVDRDRLRRLLEGWRNGEISPWDLVEQAEIYEQDFLSVRSPLPDYRQSDERSLSMGVLGLLSLAHHERLLPHDIPALLGFLDTPAGSELAAWDALDAYWDSAASEDREQQAHNLYFGRGAQ